MRASLIEARRAKYNRKESESNVNQSNEKKKLNKSNDRVNHCLNNKNDVNAHLENISQSVNSKSNVNNRKTKIPAQRKFAQGSATNTPNSSPFKTEFKTISNMSEVFTKHRPSTEDFLTFLCFRNTHFLPPHLDFYSLNEKTETPNCDSNSDHLKKENICKENSFKNLPNKSKKVMNLLSEMKLSRVKNGETKSKSLQELSQANTDDQDLNKIETIKKSLKDKINGKCEDLKNGKGGIKPSIVVNKIETRNSILKKEANVNKTKDSSKPNNSSKDTSQDSLNNNNQGTNDINIRMLRSKRSITLPETKSDIQLAVKSSKPSNANDEPSKRSQSPIGIRPYKRKAKPQALMDYHYILDEEEEEDEEVEEKEEKIDESEKIIIKSCQTKAFEKKFKNNNLSSNKSSVLNLNNVKSVKKKSTLNSKLEKNKMISQKQSQERDKKDDKVKNDKEEVKSKAKVNLKETKVKKIDKDVKKEKTKVKEKSRSQEGLKKDMLIEKRVTRSVASTSLKNTKDVEERESFIKQQIIAIEQRHKTFKNYHFENSLHSSSESTTSSESLPSSSSSTSVNIPRLTRSLEFIKQLRAKAKLEKQKQEASLNKPNDACVRKAKRDVKVVNEKLIPKRRLRETKEMTKGNKRLKNGQSEKKTTSNVTKNEMNLRSKSKSLANNNLNLTNKMNKTLEKLQACSKLIKLRSSLNKSLEKGREVQNVKGTRRGSIKTRSDMASSSSSYSTSSSLISSETLGHTKPTVDVSTFATEEDILACTGASFDDYDNIDHQSLIEEFSVATQTCGSADSLMLAMFGKLGFE